MAIAVDDFFVKDCLDFINAICKAEGVQIKIKPKRTTKYGDFRPSLIAEKLHLITVNQEENKHAVLLTILHELGHAIVWNAKGKMAKAHGKEWKESYRNLILTAIEKEFFPQELSQSLLSFANNIKSSHHYNTELVKALNSFNIDNNDFILISEINTGCRFTYRNKVYIKGDKIRTRYKCRKKNSLQTYLFNQNASVELFDN